MKESPQQAWKQFWEVTAESTSSLGAIDLPEITPQTYQAASSRIGQLLVLSAHDTVLNIGCGPGLFEERFATSVKGIIGVDFAYTMVDKARHRNSKSCNIAFFQASGTALPFKDNQFTKVLCYSVLHYFSEADLKKLLTEIRRVSLKGTTVLLGDIEDEYDSSTSSSLAWMSDVWSVNRFRKLVGRGVKRVRGEVYRRVSRLRRNWRTYTGQYVVVPKPYRLFRYSRSRLLTLVTEANYESWIVEQETERFVPGRYHVMLRVSSQNEKKDP